MRRMISRRAGSLRAIVSVLICLPILLGGNPGWAEESRGTFPYAETAAVLEMQPLDPHKAQLLYWDQSEADALRLTVPPGRPGLAAFDHAVLRKLGFEIRKGSKKLPPGSATRGPDGLP